MKKILLFILLIADVILYFKISAGKQILLLFKETHPPPSTLKRDWNKLDLSTRANDHFMLQYGLDGWAKLTRQYKYFWFFKAF